MPEFPEELKMPASSVCPVGGQTFQTEYYNKNTYEQHCTTTLGWDVLLKNFFFVGKYIHFCK